MEFANLSEQVGRALLQRGMMLCTAESCTGGWVAQVITQTSGSSQWFDRGFVTYTNQAKQEMLGVSVQTLEQFGAVSEQTVKEMAEGALHNSAAQISLAISGVAGPTGGTEEKPVGLICFAWAQHGAGSQANTMHFSGDRNEIRRQSVEYALKEMLGLIN